LIPKAKDAAATGAALRRAASVLEALPAWTAEAIEHGLRGLAEEIGWSSRDLFMLLRVAITGRTVTPPLIESISRLGKDSVLNRLERARRTLAEPASG
jgi:glutamyl-tRNA synthetase